MDHVSNTEKARVFVCVQPAGSPPEKNTTIVTMALSFTRA